MAKTSRLRPVQQEKDQTGCIWGFISIFDFRHGQSTRKLLSDRRRSSRKVVGAGIFTSNLQMLKKSIENSQENYDGEERNTVIVDAAKTSVKELMEEEMFSEQDQKKQMSNAVAEAKETDSECGGDAKKSRKRARKTSKSSCDILCDLDAAENLRPENSCNQDSEVISLKNLDLEAVMNDLCQKINQNSNSCMNDVFKNDLGMQSELTHPVFDKIIAEAIKVFVDQRFVNGMHLSQEGEINHSKEFVDALQSSSSNKELILEVLKNPNQLLVKHSTQLEDTKLGKDQNSQSSARANLYSGEQNNTKLSVPVAQKQRNFFSRSKSREKILQKGEENCQTSNRIVILKPGPAGGMSSETEEKLIPSLQSHYGRGAKVQAERNASQFSFTEIKRKLRNAIGKEWRRVPSNHISYRYPYEHQKSDKVLGRKKGGWGSPNRKHFYNERFSRPISGIKNNDPSCKQKETETNMRNGAVQYSKQKVSNFYIEAKKRLSAMLSNGDENEEFSSRQLPKTLARILSLPEFNFSPVCSPQNEKEHSFASAQQSGNTLDVVNKDTWQLKQENPVSHLGPSKQTLNCQPRISDYPEAKVLGCNTNSVVLDELNDANAEEDLCSTILEISSEGDEAIVHTTDALIQKDCRVLDNSTEQWTSPNITVDQNVDLAEVCDEEDAAQCLKLDSCEEDHILSSPLTSPSSSSTTKHVGDLECANERPELPSPVSVLEPLLTEDDISPASIKFQSVEPPMQPLRLRFEEQLPSPTNQDNFIRALMYDEETAFEYVEAVLLGSDLNWEEFFLRWFSSDQILDPSLFDEVELFSNRSFHDQKVLFDCTNEVLEKVCELYFGYYPWVSLVKHIIRPIPRGMDLISEVWEGVQWHLRPQTFHCTLEQIVRKDMAKAGSWMDIRFDVERIGFETGEAIFEELVEEAILSFTNEGPGLNPELTEPA